MLVLSLHIPKVNEKGNTIEKKGSNDKTMNPKRKKAINYYFSPLNTPSLVSMTPTPIHMSSTHYYFVMRSSCDLNL